MKARRIIVIAALSLGGVLASPKAPSADRKKVEPLVAIIHPANDEDKLSENEMKNIYLGRKRSWSDGRSVQAYMRKPKSSAGFSFLRGVLKMTPSRFRYHWQGRQLSGRGTKPKTLGSYRAVAARVASNQGGIGYVTVTEMQKLGQVIRAGKLKVISID